MLPKQNFETNSRVAVFSVDTERPFAGADDGAFDYLELMHRLDIPATFFVVGEVAEKRPDIVDAIHAQGHEIACHGWDHPNIGEPISERAKFIDELDDQELFVRLERCCAVLSRADQPPLGFRAPWFRISQQNLYVVAEHFKYDSSLSPSRLQAITVPEPLVELPVGSLTLFGPRLGTSVLFWPKGLALARRLIAMRNSTLPMIFYGHSFDLMRCPRGLRTAAWKRLWYFDRCGPSRARDIADMIRGLQDDGYEFVRCRDLLVEGERSGAL